VLGHVADAGPGLDRRHAKNTHPPDSWREEADDQFDQGRLAATVGSDDAGEVACGDLEIDALEHRWSAVKTKAQILDLDDGCGFFSFHCSALTILSAMVSRLAR